MKKSKQQSTTLALLYKIRHTNFSLWKGLSNISSRDFHHRCFLIRHSSLYLYPLILLRFINAKWRKKRIAVQSDKKRVRKSFMSHVPHLKHESYACIQDAPDLADFGNFWLYLLLVQLTENKNKIQFISPWYESFQTFQVKKNDN